MKQDMFVVLMTESLPYT